MEQADVPKGGHVSMGRPHWSRLLKEERAAHAGTGLLTGVVNPLGKPMLQQTIPEGVQPMEGTHAGADNEELQFVGRTHVGEVCGRLFPMAGILHWSRGRE